MKALGAGAVVLSAFILANVVAGGVYLVLFPLVRDHLRDEFAVLAGAMAVGAIAVACAVFFMLGFLRVVARR